MTTRDSGRALAALAVAAVALSSCSAHRPAGKEHFEQSLAAVAHAPFDTAARLALLAIVDDYVFGHVLRAGETSARDAAADEAEAAAAAELVRAQLGTGRFPHLQALADDPAMRALAAPDQLEGRFEHGLQALLDGAVARFAPGDG